MSIPRIGLLTPYSGNNLGDAAIQDALIANLRLRLQNAQFCGISINNENFVEHHGSAAYPLYAELSATGGSAARSGIGQTTSFFKKAARKAQSLLRRVKLEVSHSLGGIRFARSLDLLIVSGGGQLDEEWGGPWEHPFALFKWGVLARFAGIPFVIASVGACKVKTPLSRFFLSRALRMSAYRSYRDGNSRKIASGLVRQASKDFVIPDLAFSLPDVELPNAAGIHALASGRRIIAISPMAFAKPQLWPTPDRELYERYIRELSVLVTTLLDQNYFLVFVWSALSDRHSSLEDLFSAVPAEYVKLLAQQSHTPQIATWKDYVTVLQDADLLVATRLHSLVLGFVMQKPAVAISFDPKVDWVMQDVGQTNYLLQIRDFKAEDVMRAIGLAINRLSSVKQEIALYLEEIGPELQKQYDAVAKLALRN